MPSPIAPQLYEEGSSIRARRRRRHFHSALLRGTQAPELDRIMARPKQRPRQRLGRWELLNLIGRGGNAQVWRARSDKGEFGAIKVLQKATAERANQRFRA